MELILPLLLAIVAIFTFIIYLLLELKDDEDTAIDEICMVFLALSMIFFWVSGASLLQMQDTDYIPYAWLLILLGFVPVVFLIIKIFGRASTE